MDQTAKAAMAQAGGLCFGLLPVLPDGHDGILDCGDMWMEEILYQRGWAWMVETL